MLAWMRVVVVEMEASNRMHLWAEPIRLDDCLDVGWG